MAWHLYNGDCLEIMRTLNEKSVDAVITDPPYSSGGLMAGERRLGTNEKYKQTSTKRKDLPFAGDNRDQRSWTFWTTAWISLAVRLMKVGSRFYMFIDWRQLPAATDAVQAAGLMWRGIIPWDKGRGTRAPHTGYHRHQCEYIIFATKGRCEKAPGRGPFEGCVRATIPQKKLHLTQKPEVVIYELLRTVEPGGLILDPFAGSGTTLYVAEQEGYDSIGIEMVAEYCDVIRERMAGLKADEALG